MALALPHSIHAQTGPEQPEHLPIEEILVTGSRIARRDLTSISPVATIDRLELNLSGTINVENALNAMPQAAPDWSRTTNNPSVNPGDGGARINLRGLGAKRTLVMLNGRRLAPSGIAGAVDVNAIPAALIERIEVVTGGASAVYGSDAIAGVVNFIMKERFDGLELNSQYEVTDANDGEIYDVNLAYGLPLLDGRIHLSMFAGYQDRESILADDRDFTRVRIGDDPETGETFESGSSATPSGVVPFPPALFGGVPGPTTFNDDGTPRAFDPSVDTFNFAQLNYLQTPMERWTGGAFVNFELTSSVNAFVEWLYMDNDQNFQLAPVPVFAFVAVNTDNPTLAPPTRSLFETFYDQDGDGIANMVIQRRLSEIGLRVSEVDRDSNRWAGGIDGSLDNGWTWQAHYSYSEVDTDEVFLNDASESRLQQGLLVDPATGRCFDPSDSCAPVNLFGAGNLSAEGAAFARLKPYTNETHVEEAIWQATLSGDLLDLPAGPVKFALGVELRDLKSEFRPDGALFTGDGLGFSPEQPVKGDIDVDEVFGEVLIPLLSGSLYADYLGLEAGIRVSDYSQSGTEDTWKVGADYAPVASMRLRAMFQRAVRAPNMAELFQASSQELFVSDGNLDQCSASRDPIGQGLTEVCVAQGLDAAQMGVFEASQALLTASFGGNPDLEPEQADTITAGIVWQPDFWPALSASLDYYSIEIDDAIVDLGNQTPTACFLLKDPFADVCGLIRRGPDGNVNEIDFAPTNIGALETEGWDLKLNASFDTPALDLLDGGSAIDVSVLATYVSKFGAAADEQLPVTDCAGYFGQFCAVGSFGSVPEYRTTTRLSWSSGPLITSLRWQWIDGLENSFALHEQFFGFPPPNLAIPKIGSEHYLDVSFNYDFQDRVTLYGGIYNLLENNPPMLADEQTESNTDPSLYDPIGRRYFVGLSVRF